MARKQKERREPVTIRVPVTLREDLRALALADKRDDEADYWRKVLSEHVDEARRAGKLPLDHQLPLNGVRFDVVTAAAGGAR